MTLYFYYPSNVDYMSYLDDFHNTDEYEECKTKCTPLREDRATLKKYKSCLMECATASNNPEKVVAKLSMSDKPELAGIIYTEVFSKELTPTDMNAKNLLLVKSVQTPVKIADLPSVDVTLDDLFSPHSRINGKTLCAAIGDATNQTLSAVSYVVNGAPNPRYVEADCIDIHAKIYLGDAITRSASGIMYLLDDSEYESYCKSSSNKSSWIGRLDEKSCEIVKPWMKAGENDTPVSICSLKRGTLSNTCEVNTAQRDKIKAYLREKVNSCIGEMGCMTDTNGESRTQGKFMRRHTTKNFPSGTPTQICCKRSFKAVVKGGLRMSRLYKYVGNLSYEEQLALIKNSSMTEEEKRLFVQGVQDSHNIGEKLVEQLNIDRPTQIMMESFSIIVRNALKEQFNQFVQLNKVGELKTDAEAEKKLTEITGDKEKSGFLINMLKSAATSIASAIFEVTRFIMKTIKYFAKKSFDLLTWIFHHPTTVMWLAYSALYLKKKCCEMISLQVYGSPEMIEVGLFGKSADLLKSSSSYAADLATIVKKNFLAKTYEFVGSSMFSSYISGISSLIEHGILYVLALIPVVGIPIATSIKMSGGLTIVMSGLGQIMSEAMYYGMTAIILKEAGGDIYAIVTGTCIKKPETLAKLTTSGVMAEVSAASSVIAEKGSVILGASVSTMSIAAEQANGFFSHIYSIMPTVL
jgi:hypothetical protein